MTQQCSNPKDDQKLVVALRPSGHVGLHGVSKAFPIFKPVIGFRRRGDCEHNLNYLQLVTYNVVTCRGKIFNYRRKGSEGRLTGLRSIGAGGHVECQDLDSGKLEMLVDLNGPLDQMRFLQSDDRISPSALCKLALSREMLEELQIVIHPDDIAEKARWVG